MSKLASYRMYAYMQAEYLAYKYFYVHIHELPDGKRREVLKEAWRQIKESAGRV